MRRVWIGFGFALVAAVGFGLSAGSSRAQPAAGAADANHRKVTVSGTATVAVKPDTARVSFAVKGSGNDFKAAAADCDKKAAAVEKAIKELKVGGLEIKKGPLNYTQMHGGIGIPGGPPGGPPRGPMGPGMGQPPGAMQFEVTRTFTAVATFGKEGGAGKLDDIVEVADKLLTTAVSAGATEPPTFMPTPNTGFGPHGQGGNRVEFYRANLTTIRQEAIKAAVADGLANAKVAAGAANLTTKDIVSITDQSQFGPFGMPGQASNTGRGEVLGEMELTLTLSVTFSY